MSKAIKINSLKFDDKNFNKGTEYGDGKKATQACGDCDFGDVEFESEM